MSSAQPHLEVTRRMGRFIDASPSPYHACREAADLLRGAGFVELAELDAWQLAPGRFFVVRGGSLVAWALPEGAEHHRGFHVLGAHTDSPNLRIKPRPDTGSAGYRQLGVEVYGGVLLNSWLDRDLGLSGRLFLRGERGPEERLFLISRPVMRVPQLAIHLHPEIRSDGLKLNKQTHMAPVWGLGSGNETGFRELMGRELDLEPDSILSWDAMCHDTNPSTLVGFDEEFLSAPRLDNLASCFTALSALTESLEREPAPARIPVVSLFDHEEVGSGSSRGAASTMLRDLLERTVLGRGGTREDFHRALAGSVCVSADMAHATHPNWAAKHEPDHRLALNAGPVIKINANLRYATEGSTEAIFQHACERADVPYQKWVNRTDLACGSTIGPITAAALGIQTVDVGCPMLAMHSAREMCGSKDTGHMIRAMSTFLD